MEIDNSNLFRDNSGMDWKNIIKDLTDSGFTQSQIAALCNTGQSYICSLSKGVRKSPNWKLGESLLKLHKAKCKKSGKAA